MNFAGPLHDGSVWTLVEWLLLVERELLLFAVFWFLIGLADELLMDALWFMLRLDPQRRTPCLADGARDLQLHGRLAVFVAAWREEEVIGTTVAQMLAAWPTERFVLYVGCYCNDPATVAAASAPMQQALANGCLRPASMSAEEFTRWIRSDVRRWRDEISRLPPQLLNQSP